uniref:Uncharacterized protein n=1 Tax=Ditylum brightwellii TaxID=49249 RepID=A0A7S4S9D4_9STRA
MKQDQLSSGGFQHSLAGKVWVKAMLTALHTLGLGLLMANLVFIYFLFMCTRYVLCPRLSYFFSVSTHVCACFEFFSFAQLFYVSKNVFVPHIQFFGLAGPESTGSFFPFVFVTNHVLNKRSITWMLFLLVPIAAALCDVAGKVIGNLFYPAQVQIHMEIASQEIAHSKEKKKETAEKVN